jgi:DNA-binding CsgD family transcriptional regulator
VLSRAQIGAGNAGDGIDFVNLYGTWRDGILNSTQLAEVHALLGTSFVEHFAGYHFNRVLKEAIGDSRIALARATGTYKLLAEFPENESALAVVTRENMLAAPYSVAAAMYRYQAPVLRLRPAEQELLSAAVSGKTDAELSVDLGLSIEAAKKRWLSIFARVEDFKPEILNQAGADGEGRGPQKRHRVLAYIRAHPEELRPFTWDAKKR